MARRGLKHHGRRLAEPCLHDLEGVLGIEGTREERGVGAQPQECEHYHPGESHRLRPVEGGIEPVSRRAMMPCVGVDGIQEDVGIDDLHRPYGVPYLRVASLRAASSSSASPASRIALSHGTVGLKPIGDVGVRNGADLPRVASAVRTAWLRASLNESPCSFITALMRVSTSGSKVTVVRAPASWHQLD